MTVDMMDRKRGGVNFLMIQQLKGLFSKHPFFFNKKDTFFRLCNECLHYRIALLVAAVALLILAVTRLYLTWLVKKWTEGPLVNADTAEMHQILLSAVFTTLCMVLAILVSRYLIQDVNQKTIKRLRDRAQQNLIRAKVARVRKFQSGDLFSRIFNDAAALSLFVRDMLERVFGESMVALGAAGMMMYLDWRMTLLMCAVIPPVALLLGGLSKVIRKWSGRAQGDLGHLSAVFSEQIQGITTIKGFQAEEFEMNRFSSLSDRYRKKFMQSEIWSAVLMALVWLVTGLSLLYMIWYGSQQIVSEKISAGGLITFCLCAAQLVEPIRKLSDVYADFQRTLAAADRIFAILNIKTFEEDDRLGNSFLGGGDVFFDRVSFRYHTDEPVLESISLSVKANETVALVSPSGGGKSTISKLLIRFWDPLTGIIFLDGMDIKKLNLRELRQAVCVVEQEPFIFRGSLRDNIGYGSWNAPLSTVNNAVRMAALEDLVAELPAGLNSLLEEGGHSLSGGQKQRIAIARALVRNPTVLIFDEATSAIDSDTEGRIFERIAQWLEQRTVIIMAHRLSTISRFDRIIVMDQGRIVAEGSMAYLIENCSSFVQLFSDQLHPKGFQKEGAVKNH